jgi:hypothetical protein
MLLCGWRCVWPVPPVCAKRFVLTKPVVNTPSVRTRCNRRGWTGDVNALERSANPNGARTGNRFNINIDTSRKGAEIIKNISKV